MKIGFSFYYSKTDIPIMIYGVIQEPDNIAKDDYKFYIKEIFCGDNRIKDIINGKNFIKNPDYFERFHEFCAGVIDCVVIGESPIGNGEKPVFGPGEKNIVLLFRRRSEAFAWAVNGEQFKDKY